MCHLRFAHSQQHCYPLFVPIATPPPVAHNSLVQKSTDWPVMSMGPPPLQNYYVGPPFGIEQNGEFIQQPHHANRSGRCGAHPICIQPTGGLRGMSYLALDGHHPREGSTHAGLAGPVWPGHELGFRISMYVAILNEKNCDDLALLPHVFQFVDPLEGWETIVALRITIVPLISPRLKNSIP